MTHDPAERSFPQNSRSRISWLVATLFGVGYARPCPGTFASGITVLLWWVASHAVSHAWMPLAGASAALAVTALGIPAASVVARESGRKDPGFVVIDEVAGQMIALVGVPPDWKYLLAGFILFRGFDIVKPFPLRRLESLPAGTGIMMDDVGAGIYAVILVHLLLHLTSR